MTQFDLFAAPAYVQKGSSFVARDHRGDARPTEAESKALRDLGIHQAIENAGDRWEDLAYAFLVRFIATHQHFISEDVSDASKQWGMVQPATDRAWGSVYIKAARAGLIEQDGTGRSRRRHHSICPRWKTL